MLDNPIRLSLGNIMPAGDATQVAGGEMPQVFGDGHLEQGRTSMHSLHAQPKNAKPHLGSVVSRIFYLGGERGLILNIFHPGA